MGVRAKFYVARHENHVWANGQQTTIVLCPVMSTSEENKSFFDATPSGEIKLSVVNPEVVAQLQPGKEYYIDFTEAD